MKDKVLRDILLSVLAQAMLVAFLAWLTEPKKEDYIVLDKTDNKVLYHPIGKPEEIHVMVFKKADGFYPFIRAGDTITGPKRHMDELIAPERLRMLRLNMYYSTIIALNGKDLEQLNETVRRDSIIRSMQQKVK
ncbi:hypothetical protein HDR63_01140 [bacterium]|nr:hypothetical protein [bacterium]